MRWRGFTMIELTAAMAVVIAMLLLGMWFVPRQIAVKQEDAFFLKFEQTWRSGLREARRQQQDFTVAVAHRQLTFGQSGRITLTMPATVTLKAKNGEAITAGVLTFHYAFDKAYPFYTELMTWDFIRQDGTTRRYSWQMGWGVLYLADLSRDSFWLST